MSDAVIGKRLSYFKPYFKRVDEDCYSKGYYVSSVVWQNDGGNWYRGIAFETPESIDELIFALVYAKEAAKHQKACSYHDTYTNVRNSDNGCKAKLGHDCYVCEWCGTPHPLDSWEQYQQGKPKFCMNCGAFFNEYEQPKEDA